MTGLTVYIEKGSAVDGLSAKLDDARVNITDNKAKADIFISKNPKALGQRSQWWAACKGCFVLSPSWVLQESGHVLKYMAASAIARKIWVSPSARDHHAKLYDVIKHVATKMPSKWKLIEGDKDSFVEQFAKASKAHRGCNMVAIVRKKEEKVPSPCLR